MTLLRVQHDKQNHTLTQTTQDSEGLKVKKHYLEIIKFILDDDVDYFAFVLEVAIEQSSLVCHL